MRTPAQSTRGFTLIELIVVVSIITILSGAMLPGFTKYIANQNKRQAQEQVKSDLRTVQNKALAGVGSIDPSVVYWGIMFDDKSAKYTFFSSSGTTCGSGFNNETTSENLNGDVHTRTGSAQRCVFFDSIGNAFTNGGTVCSADLCLIQVGELSASGTNCAGIRVTGFGAIEKVANAQCL